MTEALRITCASLSVTGTNGTTREFPGPVELVFPPAECYFKATTPTGEYLRTIDTLLHMELREDQPRPDASGVAEITLHSETGGERPRTLRADDVADHAWEEPPGLLRVRCARQTLLVNMDCIEEAFFGNLPPEAD